MARPFTIATINYNTNRLTNVWLRSIIKHCRQDSLRIVILDNSDKEKFVPQISDKRLYVLNNTKSQFIDYKKELEKHGSKTSYIGWANLKHSIAVQWLIDNLKDDNMVLFDSDTVLKVPIQFDFIDESCVTKADIQPEDSEFWHEPTKQHVVRRARFMPFMQYFNIKMIRKLKLRYLDDSRIISGKNDPTLSWDTGAAFYADVIRKNLPYKVFPIKRYVNHLKGGSWARVNSEEDFIRKNRLYWE